MHLESCQILFLLTITGNTILFLLDYGTMHTVTVKGVRDLKLTVFDRSVA